jgi:tetratricopeptide (TPR) repeat protein
MSPLSVKDKIGVLSKINDDLKKSNEDLIKNNIDPFDLWKKHTEEIKTLLGVGQNDIFLKTIGLNIINRFLETSNNSHGDIEKIQILIDMGNFYSSENCDDGADKIWNSVLPILDSYINSHPDDPAGYYQKTLFQYNKKQYEDSNDTLTIAIGKKPKNIEQTYYLQGKILFRLKKFEDAFQAFERSLGSNQGNANVEKLYWKGRCLLRLERGDNLLEVAEQILSLKPDCGWAHYFKGLLFYTSIEQHPEEALRSFKLAKEYAGREKSLLKKKCKIAYIIFCSLLKLKKSDHEILVSVQEILETNPEKGREWLESGYLNEKSTTLYWMARAFEEDAKFPDSLKGYERCLEISPEYESAKLGLGRVLIKFGDDDKAFEILGQIHDTYPGYNEVRDLFDLIRDRKKIRNEKELKIAQIRVHKREIREKIKDFDINQQEIITLEPDKRILVDAAPGTGKTSVACFRAEYLIGLENIEPHNIWIISFTRTAVKEIRNRIQESLTEKRDSGINVATIDSFGWQIHSGPLVERKLDGTYNNSIKQLIGDIEKYQDLSQNLTETKHLIIDEAQDIVQERADLIIKIIRILPESCGVTVFSDQAQAIYGFTQKGNGNGISSREDKKTLVEIIRQNKTGLNFEQEEKQLTEVYRTKSKKLKKLFTEIRQRVIKGERPKINNKSELDGIIDAIKFCADENNSGILKGGQSVSFEDDLILFYGRSAALQASYLHKAKAHRIRLGKMPKYIKPWIGACFSEYTEDILSKDDFIDLWEQNVERNHLADIDVETAWNLINHSYAGHGLNNEKADMQKLRQILGRKQAPEEFCFSEIGDSGPIIGNIHASKGREEDKVRLMLPTETFPGKDNDFEEPARVYFVGATRARKRLAVQNFDFGDFKNPKETKYSERRYNKIRGFIWVEGRKMPYHLGSHHLEIGLWEDISAESVGGRAYFRNVEEVKENQKKLISFARKITEIGKIPEICAIKKLPVKKRKGKTYKHNDYCYEIQLKKEKERIGFFSDAFNYDLYDIGNDFSLPPSLDRLLMFGIRTVVVPPDELQPMDRQISYPCSQKQWLHKPWMDSGFILAPIVMGWAFGDFQRIEEITKL